MERLGSTVTRTWPSRSQEIALQVAGDQSISIHWVLPFIQVPVHWAMLSTSPHWSIKSTVTSAGILSNILLISRSTMLGHRFIHRHRRPGCRKSMHTAANIDGYGSCRAGFLQEGGDKHSSSIPSEHELLKATKVCFATAVSPATRIVDSDSRYSYIY